MPRRRRPSQTTQQETTQPSSTTTAVSLEEAKRRPPKWSLGILQDKETDEVPGSILLMSKVAERNEPLGLQHVPVRTSMSSLPSPYPPELSPRSPVKKTTADGKIILEPQPDDTPNDPLNWPAPRRDMALLSLGLYCMLGGGMTPILAAGFNDVAKTYNTTPAKVALTTGLYMMGLSIGSIVFSPTAIMFGKRPIYLLSSVLFILSSVWCALSPNFSSLILARIFQGIAVSPVECLPSATIAEIFYLHERAYRLGIYTLLLLGGKNLVPLVSAAIIQSLGWRWVFWIVAIVVGFGGALLFFFVPETFWDRTPRPRRKHKRHSHGSESRISFPKRFSDLIRSPRSRHADERHQEAEKVGAAAGAETHHIVHETPRHVGFADANENRDQAFRKSHDDFPLASKHSSKADTIGSPTSMINHDEAWKVEPTGQGPPTPLLHNLNSPYYDDVSQNHDYFTLNVLPSGDGPADGHDQVPMDGGKEASSSSAADMPARATSEEPAKPASGATNPQSPKDQASPQSPEDQASKQSPTAPRTPVITLTLPPKARLKRELSAVRSPAAAKDLVIPQIPETATGVIPSPSAGTPVDEKGQAAIGVPISDSARPRSMPVSCTSQYSHYSNSIAPSPGPLDYTAYHRSVPQKTYLQTLRPWNGRLGKDDWLKIACRPFILFAYPSILWSALMYSLSMGWLIVLSESISHIYRRPDSYNFGPMSTGLVYISPFIGGVLGTAVAGKVSDFIVRAMARRNDGIYEPEFRLVMGIPIAITTVIGLMGFGWSAEEKDQWIVPTFFFGVISFGCSLGSTTAITFAVDCYRGYAGEALVTLNFSKNILHGLVWSLFFPNWLQADGSKRVFLAIGGIQLACLLFTIPMYIYGKRARMWTVRKNLMERF